MKKYMLRFKNRFRNRFHVYFVDSITEAKEILDRFGNQVGQDKGLYELNENPSIYFKTDKGIIGVKNLFN